jgi:hypothetical protein
LLFISSSARAGGFIYVEAHDLSQFLVSIPEDEEVGINSTRSRKMKENRDGLVYV